MITVGCTTHNLVARLRKEFPVYPSPANFKFLLPLSVVVFDTPNGPFATIAQTRHEKVAVYRRKNITRDGDKHPRPRAGRVCGRLLNRAHCCWGRGQGDCWVWQHRRCVQSRSAVPPLLVHVNGATVPCKGARVSPVLADW